MKGTIFDSMTCSACNMAGFVATCSAVGSGSIDSVADRFCFETGATGTRAEACNVVLFIGTASEGCVRATFREEQLRPVLCTTVGKMASL